LIRVISWIALPLDSISIHEPTRKEHFVLFRVNSWIGSAVMSD